ncbi:hypothetical protein [Flavobacterium channae]|uniref:hypothetical protein n=1 Tax=Flavobacterium channae TaxID=2897181 RepID=UPI001E481829|nr:hypothetical protein [Flavobacterium channae]UGS23647.1 hypothetical protein LOS89_12950 [Flavobacterium channae]
MFKNKIIPFVKELFQTNEKAFKAYWALSIFFSLALAAPILNILFEFKPGIKDFSEHIISNASLYGLDVSKRVSLFYKALILIITTTLSFFIFINRITNKAAFATKEILKSIYTISIIGIFSVISGLLLINIDFSVYIMLLFVLLLVAEIKFNKLNQNVNLTVWPVLVSIPTALLFFTYFKQNNFFEIIKPEISIKTHILTIDPFLLVFVLFLLPFTFVFHFIARKNNSNPNILFKASIALVSVPIVLSFLLEFGNVVNLRFGYVFNKPFYLFTFLLIISFIVFYFLLQRYREQKLSKSYFDNYFLPILIIGLLLIMTQPWRMVSPENEFFETANHGLSIDHFFRYGSIPIIENFDAHMMHYQFFAFIYGFVNGYEPSAVMLYHSYFFAIEILVLFFVFKKIIGSFNSFVLVFCLPIFTGVINEFTLSSLLILTVLKLIENKTTRNFYVYWIVAIFLCLYKLDIGYAAVLASLITYIILDKIKYNTISVRPILKSGAFVGIVLMLIFVILCLIKGINPFFRLQEFLFAAKSDQNWGVTRMGDTSHFLFRVGYYIFPVIIAISFISVVFKYVFNNEKYYNHFKKKHVFYALAFFVFFALFFFFNAQRGIVRHNFEYANIRKITSTIPLALIMLAFFFNRKNKMIVVLTIFFISFLILNSAKTDFKDRNTTIFKDVINSYSFQEKFLEAQSFNKSRVRVAFDQSEITMFKKFLNVVLKPSETYYDFSSKNFYHALTARKNPSYVNQTPLMINGDKAQEIEIERIKEAKIPIVLMPIKGIIWHAIDEVYTDFKYYKMSEYIYKNYTPLYRMATFDIYVLKEKESEYIAKIKKAGFLENKSSFSDFTFFNTDAISKNNLQVGLNPDKSITINAIGASSHFIGLMDYLRKQNLLKETNLPCKLGFSIQSFSQGNIRIYYKLTPEESFSENYVKEFPITSLEDTKINLDLPKTPVEIMVAVNTSGIVLKQFNITNGSQSEIKNPEKIDYFIGFVPKIWAEESEEIAFEKVKPLKEIEEETFASINSNQLNSSSQGCFAYLELESDGDSNGIIEIISDDNVKASYAFSIVPGKHSYAIRISNSYYWWNTNAPKINFRAEKVMKISKFSLISSDGSQQKTFKGNGITLTNLNDENWINGCSLQYNMVLFDYSPKREKLLKEFKKIRLSNGSVLNIKGFYVSGNYINVTISEKIPDYISLIGYPNPIEFIK